MLENTGIRENKRRTVLSARPAQLYAGRYAIQLRDNRPRSYTTSVSQTYLTDNRARSVTQKKENKTGLPDQLRSGIETLSGYSMGDVKVHYNSDKPSQLHAHAYAQGTDIHIASGQEKHLPHEAWHVVQQKQGRVKPTTQLKGKINVNDDKGLEKEADVMGSKVMQMKMAKSPIIFPVNHIVENHALMPTVLQGNFLSELIANPGGKLVGNSVTDYLIPTIFGRIPGLLGTLNENTPRFGPRTGRGFGTFGEIKATKELEGGKPDRSNDTWEALRIRRRPSGESYYIRGHLINEHMNGPGNDWLNLTPLTDTTNHHHSQQVEEAVKREANYKGVFYRVQAIYGHTPWQWPNQVTGFLTKSLIPGIVSLAPGPHQFYLSLLALRDAEQHIPVRLQCDWWTHDGKHHQRVVPQVANSGAGFWVNLNGNKAHDLTRAETILSLIDEAVALTLKAYLMPSIPSIMTNRAARVAIALLHARPRFSARGLFEAISVVLGGELAAMTLLERVDWNINSFWRNMGEAAVLDILSKITGIKRFKQLVESVLFPEVPIAVNREERELLGSLPDDVRPLFNHIIDDDRLIGTPGRGHARPGKTGKKYT